MLKPKSNNKKQISDSGFEVFAQGVTRWIGSPSSILAHTLFFLMCFVFGILFADLDKMLLFLTTVVSLEAIYLAILIQYTVNKNTENLAKVGEDIDEIQEDIDEIQEDIDEIQEDVDDIEEGDTEEEKRDKEIKITVERIQSSLETLMKDIESLKLKK